MLGIKRGRISIFGKFIVGNGDVISSLGKSVTNESSGLDSNFNYLIKDIQTFYIEPFYKEEYDILETNLFREVREILDISVYVKNGNLSVAEITALRYDDNISRISCYDFFTREISKYLELYKESNENAYKLLNDGLNIVNRGYYLVLELRSAQQTIESITNQITYNNSRRYGMNTMETSHNANLQFDITYLLYIQRYGNPIGGVFDAKLLGDISRELMSDYSILVDEIEPINPNS